MEQLIVSFKDVVIGDKIYDSNFYAPNSRWREVTKTVTKNGTTSIGVGVSVRKDMDTRTYFVGHKDEGIGIMR